MFLEVFAVQHSWERVIIFIQYLYPNDTRPQARKSRKQYADLCEVGDRTVLRSRVGRYCKNVGFSWLVPSSLASSATLDIVKAEMTQMVEISWEPSDYSIQTSPSCPRPK